MIGIRMRGGEEERGGRREEGGERRTLEREREIGRASCRERVSSPV